MNRASRLATSTTKIEPRTDRKAFVTLRFAGDDLDPAEISALLPVAPSRARMAESVRLASMSTFVVVENRYSMALG